jgi:hypothetical protein
VKCGSAAALEFERSIYQEVLPSLPLPSLRCYGFLEARWRSARLGGREDAAGHNQASSRARDEEDEDE